MEVATRFLEAYGAFDADQAITYLADDADISQMIASVGARSVEGTLEEFRLLISLLEAQGYKQTLISCEELGSSASGTNVRCTSDYHTLSPMRSDEVLSAPSPSISPFVMERSFKLERILESRSSRLRCGTPSPGWVSKAYPDAAAVMYEDGGTSGVRLTEESIRLWERHTRGYVEEVGR